VCRAGFELKATTTTAADASSSLPVNRFASTVLAAAASLFAGQGHEDPNNVVCEICEENPATEFCKNCSQFFCCTCKKPHLKAKVSAHHQFISLDEALTPGVVSRILRCERHPQQETNTYCHTDKQAFCAECSVDSHVGHQVERLTSAVLGFKEEISNLVKKVFLFSPWFLRRFFRFLIAWTIGKTRPKDMIVTYPRPSR